MEAKVIFFHEWLTQKALDQRREEDALMFRPVTAYESIYAFWKSWFSIFGVKLDG